MLHPKPPARAGLPETTASAQPSHGKGKGAAMTRS